MVMEPGYPRPLTSEFPGLTGSIRAALAVPATRSSPESVYFFKSGDIMQRFSFPAGSAPSCSKPPSTPPKTRFTRQAGLLGAEVNIRVSLKGFPSPVTSALSRAQRGGLFEHYVFSGPLFFSVRISGDLLVLTTPPRPAAPAPPPILSPVVYSDFTNMADQNANTPPPANSIRVWLPSPQEVRRTLMKIFVLAKRRYYTSFWLPGPETLFPIDLHGERVVCKSLDNFF